MTLTFTGKLGDSTVNINTMVIISATYYYKL
jgi:hypothetical protein